MTCWYIAFNAVVSIFIQHFIITIKFKEKNKILLVNYIYTLQIKIVKTCVD